MRRHACTTLFVVSLALSFASLVTARERPTIETSGLTRFSQTSTVAFIASALGFTVEAICRKWRDRIRGISPAHSRDVVQRDTHAPAVGGGPH